VFVLRSNSVLQLSHAGVYRELSRHVACTKFFPVFRLRHAVRAGNPAHSYKKRAPATRTIRSGYCMATDARKSQLVAICHLALMRRITAGLGMKWPGIYM
jgi:hypothetical protein